MAADRLRGALWGLFAGAAVARPPPWYYGGERQVQGDYNGPITGYVQPKSIMMGSMIFISVRRPICQIDCSCSSLTGAQSMCHRNGTVITCRGPEASY